MKREIIGKRGVKVRDLNRRRAIRHHCHMCCDFIWQAVVDCDRGICPLHPYRVGKRHVRGVPPAERAAAIGHFCMICASDATARSRCEATDCALHPYREGDFDNGEEA